jgi:hypothetical protein
MLKKKELTMKRASKGLKAALVLLVCVAMPALVMAQTNFETADGTDPGDITDIPINGGTVFLIAAGVALAAYRIYSVLKANKQLGIAK